MCKRLEITDRIRYSVLPGCHLQAVERGEGHVEVCPVLVHASGLASLERSIALGITEFKFHQEPTSVDFYDVGTCKGEVVGEEYLVLALVLGEPDNYLDFLLQGLAVDGPAEALSTIESVVKLKELLHVELVHVHLSIILLGCARQSGLWSLVEIVERSVIPEAGDDLQPHFGKAVHEVPLREECISHHPLGILENLLRETSEHMHET